MAGFSSSSSGSGTNSGGGFASQEMSATTNSSGGSATAPLNQAEVDVAASAQQIDDLYSKAIAGAAAEYENINQTIDA